MQVREFRCFDTQIPLPKKRCEPKPEKRQRKACCHVVGQEKLRENPKDKRNASPPEGRDHKAQPRIARGNRRNKP